MTSHITLSERFTALRSGPGVGRGRAVRVAHAASSRRNAAQENQRLSRQNALSARRQFVPNDSFASNFNDGIRGGDRGRGCGRSRGMGRGRGISRGRSGFRGVLGLGRGTGSVRGKLHVTQTQAMVVDRVKVRKLKNRKNQNASVENAASQNASTIATKPRGRGGKRRGTTRKFEPTGTVADLDRDMDIYMRGEEVVQKEAMDSELENYWSQQKSSTKGP